MAGLESQPLPAMAVDRTGRIALAGGLTGSVDFGGSVLTSPGEQDALVVVLDASGNYVWGDRFGDEHCQTAAHVAFAGEHGVLVSGWFMGTISFGGRTLTPYAGADPFVAMVGP